MSTKRKDNKGRVLRNGECQRKDGRYQYDYVDAFGKTKSLYSWKLKIPTHSPQGSVNAVLCVLWNVRYSVT